MTVALWLAIAPGASAQVQQPGNPVARMDVTGVLAWFNADKADLDEYDNWYNRAIYGGAALGWYWTDNLKTEVDVGVTSRADRDVYSVVVVDGRQISRESTFHFSTRRVTLGQQYQLYRNVWFHPHVAAGLDLTWEKTDREDDVLFIFDPVARQTLPASDEQDFPTRTDFHARPYLGLGFKAYMTQRAFFRSDLRLVFRNGVDEVLLRFGFGADF
jgi:outer membrane protein W